MLQIWQARRPLGMPTIRPIDCSAAGAILAMGLGK